MDRSIMEENIPEINPEDLMALYEQRLQEQTGIMFALVGKLGGKVRLTQDDLTAFPEFNTVNARVEDENVLVLELVAEDQ
jgi:hypothetical protein